MDGIERRDVMPSDEEARLRRALKKVAEQLETLTYVLPSGKAQVGLTAIAREARAALAETPADPRGG